VSLASLIVAIAWPGAACGLEAGEEPAGLTDLVARAQRAGLRVFEGRRLVLVTDRPARPGDGLDELPEIFGQAFRSWCRHYRIDPDSLPSWRALGCLVVDRERFRAAGLMPATVPDFADGFCDRWRFWFSDQSNPAYRRHLLLHEGVHAFTITVRDLSAPAWYAEGIAEHLAAHRLERDRDGGPRFVPAPVPERPGDAEQFGRIEAIRRLRLEGSVPSLDEVLSMPAGRHREVAAYAGSWAAVTLLALHPAHAPLFEALERGPLGPDLNGRLAALPGWDAGRAARDFDALTQDLDYGFDFERMAIDWSPGRRPRPRERVTVRADRGWQNTGLELEAGRGYDLSAEGRCRIGVTSDPATGMETVLESEAEGISFGWYRGRWIGRLLVGQWREAGGGRPQFRILAEGAANGFEAGADGPLFVRINEAPGALADNAGELVLELRPREAG